MERAEKTLRRIANLKADRLDNEKCLVKVITQKKELESKITVYEEKMRILRQEEDLKAVREFREAGASFEEEVNSDLKHLEKPIVKTLKLFERGTMDKEQHKFYDLERFIEDPKNTLLKIRNIKILEDALIYLQNLLKEKKLNLKTSRNKKALEVISNLLHKDKILEYKRRFNELNKEEQRKLESGASDKISELENIKKRVKQLKEELEEIIKEKNTIEEQIASCKEKTSEYNTKLKELM